MNSSAQTDAIHQVEKVRNRIAIFLVGSFVGALITFTFVGIPADNKDIITYMVGQLSGMATMALGFYFVNKIGQDAADAKRMENTGKALEAIQAVAANTGAPTAPDAEAAAAAAAQQTADAAQDEAAAIAGERG